MDVLHNNRLLKILPKKYEPIIKEIPDLIMDEDKIRLSEIERGYLNLALLRHHYIKFKANLLIKEPYVFDFVPESLRPVALRHITRRDDSIEFIIELEMDINLKCHRDDFPGVDFLEGHRW